MRLALTDLFKARWTDQIHEEWLNALLQEGKHSKEKLERTRELMDKHVRDAKVTDYEGLIETLSLPDPDDRHVLAAAIRANADAIVTFNQKDFPKKILSTYSIDVIHPDEFVYYQIDMAPAISCQAIKAQRLALKSPKVTTEEFLAILQKQQLPQTVSKLRDYAEFL